MMVHLPFTNIVSKVQNTIPVTNKHLIQSYYVKQPLYFNRRKKSMCKYIYSKQNKANYAK